MIETIDVGHSRVVGLRASGRVTHQDYAHVLVPTLEAALARASAAGHKLRFYYELGEDFEGYTKHALWDDAKIGGMHLHDFERIAVVSEHPMILAAVRMFGPLVSGEVRVWPNQARVQARAWIGLADHEK
ncbi:STAS/SEC14 domain-containing protein [Pseudenhygromyxa sp. WMMC2535]|uniref:STAS/SEC14 domain-containing protein n=1 Tax=Pseudenhygromyxa sp. WMMC2535 TaxID=2712867 RepID=UPI0015566F90|nr:STAS/SEC14 domain-containing protein [Pseudenhygromyxa sp. WMMC2535]NVB37389.1 STAS/SEC14 domain-containing protein [Pseudenhygromyxa sp. WMMC2535]